MSTEQHKPEATSALIITLTLPQVSSDERTATLVIQRDGLAHVRQFTYTGVNDLAAAIESATTALTTIEENPPVVPDTPPATAEPKTKPERKAAAKRRGKEAQPKEAQSSEPTIEVPTKKGAVEVKISHLKIVDGETDAAAYRQAVLIAGRLIDGKLWDGSTPLHFNDVYATQRKLKTLTDKDFSLFTLADFVQTGDEITSELTTPPIPPTPPTTDKTPVRKQATPQKRTKAAVQPQPAAALTAQLSLI